MIGDLPVSPDYQTVDIGLSPVRGRITSVFFNYRHHPVIDNPVKLTVNEAINLAEKYAESSIWGPGKPNADPAGTLAYSKQYDVPLRTNGKFVPALDDSPPTLNDQNILPLRKCWEVKLGHMLVYVDAETGQCRNILGNQMFSPLPR